MAVALGITMDDEGKNHVVMQFDSPGMSTAVTLASEDTYLDVIGKLIEGLKQVSRDMRKAKSGLHVVKEIPDGLKPKQGGI